MITKERVLRIEGMKKQIDELYKALDAEVDALYKEVGEITECYLHEDAASETKYLRIALTDNIRKLQSGETLFRAASIKPVDIEIDRLKKEPKDTVIINE